MCKAMACVTNYFSCIRRAEHTAGSFKAREQSQKPVRQLIGRPKNEHTKMKPREHGLPDKCQWICFRCLLLIQPSLCKCCSSLHVPSFKFSSTTCTCRYSTVMLAGTPIEAPSGCLPNFSHSSGVALWLANYFWGTYIRDCTVAASLDEWLGGSACQAKWQPLSNHVLP